MPEPACAGPGATASADRELRLHLYRRSLKLAVTPSREITKRFKVARQVAGISGISDSATTIGRATVYDVIRLPRRSIGVCGAIVSEVYGVAAVPVDVGFLTG
jgi:hypothetical protein